MSDLDIHLELAVLRGPVPPRDGVVLGGVVGELRDTVISVRKLMIAIAISFFAGIGGTFAWVYTVGLEKGQEISNLRDLEKRMEILEKARDRELKANWLSPAGRDSQNE